MIVGEPFCFVKLKSPPFTVTSPPARILLLASKLVVNMVSPSTVKSESEVKVSESDHIANLLAAPDPSIVPPPSISITLPLESTAKVFVAVPEWVPEP